MRVCVGFIATPFFFLNRRNLHRNQTGFHSTEVILNAVVF